MKEEGWLDEGVGFARMSTTVCHRARSDFPFSFTAVATDAAQLTHVNRRYELSQDS